MANIYRSCLASITLFLAVLDSRVCWPANPSPNEIAIGSRCSDCEVFNFNYIMDSTILTRNEDWITYDELSGRVVGVFVQKSHNDPERVAVIAGGPGFEYVTLYFRSKSGQAMDSRIQIYATRNPPEDFLCH
ncbi:hypothetical protein QAD02_010728 [Eretmocerus hayati]|uniref:Uncharacterized protein n=1 Tax=Eretmocerus hayati TaxID=131215 RepID=A0ACC2NV40_9HYME|nr:hypothetical protein QAD02_010728 [Eretmocerus hayati]